MVVGQLGDDAWTSLRTLWREERWLPAGVAVAAVAYCLWVGLTGAALTFLLETIAGTLTFRPWTSLTTVVVVLVVVLWIVGPAALATVFVLDRLTNVNGNLRLGYRLRHPSLLLGPPATILAVGYLALVVTATPSWPVLAVLVAGALWFVVRTVAYAYRVFSLSVPVVADLLVFTTAFVLASATVIAGAVAVGREAALSALLSGLADRTGIDAVATVHTGTATVGGVAVPRLAVGVVAIPVGLSVAYVGIQLAWSAVVRAWQPTVRRPELRTGQRYPDFARPTTSAGSEDGWTPVGGPKANTTNETEAKPGAGSTEADSVPSGSGAASPGGEATPKSSNARATPDQPGDGATDTSTESSPADPNDGDGHSGEESTAETEDVTHTRVFTPPDDAGPDADGHPCSACGDPVPPAADVCPSCGASADVA